MHKKYCVHHEQGIENVLSAINENGNGFCLIADNSNKIIGMITDGDIRRALIENVLYKKKITEIMRKDFFSLAVGYSEEEKITAFKRYDKIPILDTDKRLFGILKKDVQISLAAPNLNGNELSYLTECINTGWISSQGKYINQFEKKFGEYIGNPYTIAVSNGTVALHLAMVAIGITKGDEVIAPNLTFASPINAILYTAATPVLVDVDLNSYALLPQEIEKKITKKTKAILVVHLYGHPADMRSIVDIAQRHNLLIIEDCAEAIGTKYNGTHVGNFGDVATFSFFGNKTITTGEGGMVVFRKKEVCDYGLILRDHGMSKIRRYWHDHIGFNYRMTNMQAAIGVAQVERIEEFVSKKIWIGEYYREKFKYNKNLVLPQMNSIDHQSSYWLFTLNLKAEYASARDKIIDWLKRKSIEARPVFFPVSKMPPYRKLVTASEEYINSHYLSESGISLPSSVLMSQAEIDIVCEEFDIAMKIYCKAEV